ncbi:MAG: 5-methyltetrahydropteroyltriglutamate--homocysteine methyltransferase [Bacteroidetes bacterium]|nr:5-methyltetrahydropteroyltriglutamate--homocysteine methyltransferase [Bacteroidota bacterium]
MQTNILGYPRIGSRRELKKACESYWAEKITEEELRQEAKAIRIENWLLQQKAGIGLIPSNDFSYYDQVLDLSLTLGAIPARYASLVSHKTELYFAMARGYQQNGHDIIAMEMTKWFDTNYHYIVPEFVKGQEFHLFQNKALDEYIEAKLLGIETKPVVIGPVSYLLLGKEKESGFDRLDLMERLLPPYIEMLQELENAGAIWIQMDEPFLVLDIDPKVKELYKTVYQVLKEALPKLRIIITTYFEGLNDNISLAVNLACDALHIDLVRSPEQLDIVLERFPPEKFLSLGIVDGRNIWKNDFEHSLPIVKKAADKLGSNKIMVASSCSFLHIPCDLELETKDSVLSPEIKQWMAFAKQKVEEITTLNELLQEKLSSDTSEKWSSNKLAIESQKISPLIHNEYVKKRLVRITKEDFVRKQTFTERQKIQRKLLGLPLFPTTTVGSFPQTKEVRAWRARFKKGELSEQEYTSLLHAETKRVVDWQEQIGLDVLVHGEFERNDMVEYFGERLAGFAFTQNGWVQSYGSRCVKPPVIYGDVFRPYPMTVEWSSYAQSLTNKPMKGMLTGPVTILQWSFVRNDQPRSETCRQIALAIRDEVSDLEEAGIKIIQIDEPAIREGLPLRKQDWKEYLDWAVSSFCLSASVARGGTQIHTHMCYSEFNDIIQHIALMDADVITIECSRSQMELLDTFAEFKYPNEIGPGVYDIHSPRIPSAEEIYDLMQKAINVINPTRLWVNPDCGLKTRGWSETRLAINQMIQAAKRLRMEFNK